MKLRKEGGKSWDIYTHWQMPCAQVRTNGSAPLHKCHRHGFQKHDFVFMCRRAVHGSSVAT